MNRTSQGQHHTSLVGQLKRSRLIVASLIASIFIFSIPVSIIASPSQHNLDVQKGALQEDLNSILISMVNQETGLRRYITTANSAFLQPFTNGRPQYLLAEQRLASQAQGSDFKETTRALGQVDERANAWYSTYAQVQLQNLQSGQLETARAASTNALGKALFDQFRAAVAHLQDALGQDLTTIQSRLMILGWVIFVGVVLLAVLAVIVLWRTLSRFLKALGAQLNFLMSATTLLGSGDLSARVQELAYDELNHLGQTFNTMAQDLEGTTGEVLQQRDELLVLNEALEIANRARNQFLANMSHELRTPLNAIIGFTELIYDEEVGPISEEQKEYLGDTLSSSRHLLQLITDVLDLAKIEAGKMTFLPEPVDLEELAGEVRNILRPLTAGKRLHMEMEIDAQLGGVTVDPAKLKQVLYNYLSNAIKFTPEEGQITIRLRAEGEDAFRLEVEDTGIGIEPEDLGRLFVEFQQLDAGLTKQYQGTGLGLALTRRIVEAQGGRVGVHSNPGQGSTFFAILPRISTMMVEREDEEDVAKPMLALPARTDAPSVLIVEDEAKDRRQLIQAFTDAGYHVEVAATGTQAIAQCRQRSFDVITLDLLLPDLSGWDVLRAIRGEGPNREVPVIVITLVAEKEVVLGFPIHDVLNKPVTLEQLFSSLERAKKSHLQTSGGVQ
jgi:signal transduction histidine kinase/ActR/RegA family two-component response regulator